MDMKTKKIWLGVAAVAVLAGGGVAIAQTGPDGHRGMHGAKGGMMMMADANKDGTITRAEADAAATTHFQKMDANKDGKIDQADRDAMRAQFKAQAFNTLDANKDGTISKDEFAAPRAARGDDAAGKRDGMRAMRGGKRGGHGGPDGMRGGMRGGMMADADTNGDKAISLAEFQAAHAARFAAMDTNKDGSVTKAEMDAHRTAMKAAMKAKRAAATNNNAN